jgi:hypothetical protein
MLSYATRSGHQNPSDYSFFLNWITVLSKRWLLLMLICIPSSVVAQHQVGQSAYQDVLQVHLDELDVDTHNSNL